MGTMQHYTEMSEAEQDAYFAAAEEAHHAEQRAAELELATAEAREIEAASRPFRSDGCTCSDQQLFHVGCDCHSGSCFTS